jgi:hypothetical protein
LPASLQNTNRCPRGAFSDAEAIGQLRDGNPNGIVRLAPIAQHHPYGLVVPAQVRIRGQGFGYLEEAEAL